MSVSESDPTTPGICRRIKQSIVEGSDGNPKPIFVVFAMDKCPACEMCKQFVTEVCTPEQQNRISFIDVKDPSVKDIVIANKISAIPTIFKISLNTNTVLPRIEGFDAKKLDLLFGSD